jgi:hypothetical protein
VTSRSRALGRAALAVASRLHLVAAAAYIGVLAAELNTIAAQLRTNSDVAAVILTGQAIADGSAGRPIEIGQPAYAWLSAAMTPLGHLSEVTTYAPLLISWIGLVAIVLAVRRVAGPWAAGLAAALGIGAAPAALLTEVAPAFHGITWCMTGVLGLFLVLVARGGRRSVVLPAAVVMGLVAGAAAATDGLLVVTGLLPLVPAALWMFVRGRRRVAGVLIAVAVTEVCAAAAFVALHLWMASAGYSSGLGGGTSRGNGLSAMADHLRVIGRGVLDLANGLTVTSDRTPAVGIALAVLAVALVCGAILWVGRRAVADRDIDVDSDRRAAHVAYWVFSAVLLLGALTVSSVVTPGSGSPVPTRLLSTQRYLTALFLVAVALVPLAPRRPATRAVTAVLVAVFVAVSAVRVAAATGAADFQRVESRSLPALQATLTTHGLHRGYASFWNAVALRYSSGGAVDMLSTAEGTQCGGTDPNVICRNVLSVVGGWYTPAFGPTFVVVDPTDQYMPTAPPASIGTPVDTFTVDRFTVYVYADDVMARFVATCAGRADHACTH